jgi:transcriptional regulator with XRE-family HTH domain
VTIHKKVPIADFTNEQAKEAQVLSKAFIRSSIDLDLTRQELCAITGMSEASLSRFFNGKSFLDPQSKEGEIAILFLRVYRSLDALFGHNTKQAKLWLRGYNFHLKGIPADLIKTIYGLTEVTVYLDAMRGKL